MVRSDSDCLRICKKIGDLDRPISFQFMDYSIRLNQKICVPGKYVREYVIFFEPMHRYPKGLPIRRKSISITEYVIEIGVTENFESQPETREGLFEAFLLGGMILLIATRNENQRVQKRYKIRSAPH